MRTGIITYLFFIAVQIVMAQEKDYVNPDYVPEKQRKENEKKSFGQRIYWGGTFGLSFGTFTSVLAEPLIGYAITPKLSAGVGIGIRYGNDSRYNIEFTNYIGRIFTRYLIFPRAYLHVEYTVESYDNVFYFEGKDPYDISRTNVPFLFVGGGYRFPVGERSSFIIQVLFNTLQSNQYSRQVYPSGQPLISLGFMAGF